MGDKGGQKAKRRADQAMVFTYHQARLADLLEHVRDGFADYDGGRIDAFQLDDIIHHYKRAANELWKFCAVSGSQVEMVARVLERMPGEHRARLVGTGRTKADVTGRVDEDAPLRFPQPDDVFQLRISLLEVEPTIWRRLLVPQDVALPRFHAIIQVCMGWTDSHLHQFKVGEVRFGQPDDEYEPGPINYRRVSLNQLLPSRGSTCIYEYDFGDGWEHLIELEDELPAQQITIRLPRCIGGERSCPPEDCGGPHGYAEFLAAIRDPRHEEHEAQLRWAGGSFDAEAFDVDEVNRLLLRFASRPSPRMRC